jgi:hypothetical protein
MCVWLKLINRQRFNVTGYSYQLVVPFVGRDWGNREASALSLRPRSIIEQLLAVGDDGLCGTWNNWCLGGAGWNQSAIIDRSVSGLPSV